MPDTIWRCILSWQNTTLNLFAQNNIYMQDVTNVLTPEQVGAQIDDFFWGLSTAQPSMRNWTSTNVKLTQISLQRVSPLPALGTINYTTQQRFGGAANVVKSPVLGVLLTLKTGGAGRRNRGRFYHYGATQTILTDTGPTPANIAPTGPIGQTAVDLMNKFGPGGATDLRWMLHHRGEIGDAAFVPFTSISINPRPVVQRRRNIGIGF